MKHRYTVKVEQYPKPEPHWSRADRTRWLVFDNETGAIVEKFTGRWYPNVPGGKDAEGLAMQRCEEENQKWQKRQAEEAKQQQAIQDTLDMFRWNPGTLLVPLLRAIVEQFDVEPVLDACIKALDAEAAEHWHGDGIGYAQRVALRAHQLNNLRKELFAK